MAQTITLNSNDTILITTFWGGERGRCYTIHLFVGEMEMETTLTEQEFFEMVINYNDDIEVSTGRAKPEVSNRGLVRKADPELERLLDEEEEIANRTKQATAADADRRHPCTYTLGCENTVPYDDEPWCFTHSPAHGSSVKGYSWKREHQQVDEDQ